MTQSNRARKTMLHRLPAALVVTASLLMAGAWFAMPRSAAQEGLAIPAPALDGSSGQEATSEVAVLAGGCFWGVQGVFQHVKGVSSAVSGYVGGDVKTARYEIVGRGSTGHAEAVRVTFDPRQISYGRILQIYFSAAHDPTQLNRQGRMSAPSIDRRSSRPTRSRRGSPRDISPNSIRRASSTPRSSQKSSPTGPSIRPRIIIRTS